MPGKVQNKAFLTLPKHFVAGPASNSSLFCGYLFSKFPSALRLNKSGDLYDKETDFAVSKSGLNIPSCVKGKNERAGDNFAVVLVLRCYSTQN